MHYGATSVVPSTVPVVTDTWTYGERLAAMRKASKLSQEGAARAIGVGTLSYGKWERGQQNPSDENLKAIAETFKVDPRDLGYVPPQGWELVPSAWIRDRFDAQDATMAELLKIAKRIDKASERKQ